MRHRSVLGQVASDCRSSETLNSAGQCVSAADIRGKACKTPSGAAGIGNQDNECVGTVTDTKKDEGGNAAMWIGGAAALGLIALLAMKMK
jgi:hypothetical protein